MKSSALSIGLILALFPATASLGQTPRHKVEQEIIGPAWVPGMIYTLSPAGSRLATTYTKDSKGYVAIDNVDGEPFDEKMKRFAATLEQHQATAVRLDATIAAALRALGYGA